jgi:hypothetical protein
MAISSMAMSAPTLRATGKRAAFEFDSRMTANSRKIPPNVIREFAVSSGYVTPRQRVAGGPAR